MFHDLNSPVSQQAMCDDSLMVLLLAHEDKSLESSYRRSITSAYVILSMLRDIMSMLVNVSLTE